MHFHTPIYGMFYFYVLTSSWRLLWLAAAVDVVMVDNDEEKELLFIDVGLIVEEVREELLFDVVSHSCSAITIFKYFVLDVPHKLL